MTLGVFELGPDHIEDVVSFVGEVATDVLKRPLSDLSIELGQPPVTDSEIGRPAESLEVIHRFAVRPNH